MDVNDPSGRRTSPWLAALAGAAFVAFAFVGLAVGGVLDPALTRLTGQPPDEPERSPAPAPERTPEGDETLEMKPGSGNVISRDVPVGTFDTLRVSAPFRVTVQADAPTSVTIRADDNVIDDIEVDVDDSTLRIGLRPGTSIRDATLEADVAVAHLEGIEANGAARIVLADPVTTDELDVRLTGSSRLAGPLTVGEAVLRISGASRAELTGDADVVRARIDGASRLDAEGLRVRDLQIQLSGASRAVVWADQRLRPDVSGASRLVYRGDPQVEAPSVREASSLERN